MVLLCENCLIYTCYVAVGVKGEHNIRLGRKYDHSDSCPVTANLEGMNYIADKTKNFLEVLLVAYGARSIDQKSKVYGVYEKKSEISVPDYCT